MTGSISSKARIGNRVEIGNYVTIYDNVIIGDDVVIEPYTVLGAPTKLAEGLPLKIGSNSLIRSHSIFYEGSEFGEGLVTGNRVTVREKVKAGRNLQIGTLSDFQGHTEIGEYVRTHSNVHIGQKSLIGNYVWIFPYVVLTNDPHPPSNVLKGVTVEDYAVIATMSCVMPGVRIGRGSLVAAHSMVRKDVMPGQLVGGVPAKEIGRLESIKLQDGSERQAYPWTRHFHRGYPEQVVTEWRSE